MNRVVPALVTLCLAAQSLGCAATMNAGSSQTVRFASVPSGATVRLGSRELETPAQTTLNAERSYLVKFSKPGYRDEYVSLERKISAAFWIGLPIWGPLELLSFLDGSAYELKPSEVSVTLEEATLVYKKGTLPR